MNTRDPTFDSIRNHLGAYKMQSKPFTRQSWRGVFFDGPQSDQNHDGDEVPVWVVYVGNQEAEPLGKVYRCYSFALAESLARRMAKDRHLELVAEAMPD